MLPRKGVVRGQVVDPESLPIPGVSVTASSLELLPVARTLNAAVLLAPGVAPNGPNNNIVISGALSYENLFLINGVTVNENLRAQPLFIEDAIQETKASTAAISAEYSGEQRRQLPGGTHVQFFSWRPVLVDSQTVALTSSERGAATTFRRTRRSLFPEDVHTDLRSRSNTPAGDRRRSSV